MQLTNIHENVLKTLDMSLSYKMANEWENSLDSSLYAKNIYKVGIEGYPLISVSKTGQLYPTLIDISNINHKILGLKLPETRELLKACQRLWHV